MKHIAKNVYVRRLDKFNIELLEKTIPRDKEGEYKTDSKGELKVNFSTIGYYGNWEHVWNKLCDLALDDWCNNDLIASKKFIDQASKNLSCLLKSKA